MSSIDFDDATAIAPWPVERRQRATLVAWAIATLVGIVVVLVGVTVVFGPAGVVARATGAVLAARCGSSLLLWLLFPSARERMARLG